MSKPSAEREPARRHRSHAVARRVLAIACVVGLSALAAHGLGWRLPDRHNPFAELDYAEPPGWLTRFKLARLSDDPQRCRDWLRATGWAFQAVPDRETGPGCGIRDAVRIERLTVAVTAPFTLSCPAAASLALWERHVLQPEAKRLLGADVRHLDHFGSYACRNVYGRAEGRRSQHATADALDIAGFRLSDGRRVTVARDWAAADAPASRFLQSIHAGACGVFDGVLGPEYNAAHADHFHLDRGRFRICR